MIDLAIVSKHGVPIIIEKFTSELDERVVDAHASLFEAIDTYAKSEMGTSLKEIRMQDRIIRIEKIESFSVILVSKESLPLIDILRNSLSKILKEYEKVPDLLLQASEDLKQNLREVIRKYSLIAGAVNLFKKLKEEYTLHLRDEFTIVNLPKIRVEKLKEYGKMPKKQVVPFLVSVSIYDALNLISAGNLLSALRLLEKNLSGQYEKILYAKLAILLQYLPVQNLPSVDLIKRILDEITDETIREYLQINLKSLTGMYEFKELMMYVRKNKQEIIRKLYSNREKLHLYTFVFIDACDPEISRMVIDTFRTISSFLTCMTIAFLFLSNIKDFMELEDVKQLGEYVPYIQSKINTKVKGYEWLLLPKLLLLWDETIKKWQIKPSTFLSDVKNIYSFWRTYCKRAKMELIPVHIRLLIDILGCIIPFLILIKYAHMSDKEIKEIAREVKKLAENRMQLSEIMRKTKRTHPILFFIEEMFLFLAYAKSLILLNIFSPKLLDYIITRLNVSFVFETEKQFEIYAYIYLLTLFKIIEVLITAFSEEKMREYNNIILRYMKEFDSISNKTIIWILLRV